MGRIWAGSGPAGHAGTWFDTCKIGKMGASGAVVCVTHMMKGKSMQGDNRYAGDAALELARRMQVAALVGSGGVRRENPDRPDGHI